MASKVKIYLAGPLFSPGDRVEMEDIAKTLETAGYNTFLPQRDGFLSMELGNAVAATGYDTNEGLNIAYSLVFMLDVYQLVTLTDAVVVNLNGRSPDDGALIELGIAFALGKPIVLYKDDPRTFAMGTENPMVSGTANFNICTRLDHLVSSLDDALNKLNSGKAIEKVLDVAQQLFSTSGSKSDVPAIVNKFLQIKTSLR